MSGCLEVEEFFSWYIGRLGIFIIEGYWYSTRLKLFSEAKLLTQLKSGEILVKGQKYSSQIYFLIFVFAVSVSSAWSCSA